MSRFNPVALECLAVLMEEGSFDRAARRLSITQSAVSQRLRSLETDAGTVLIVRSRPLQLTAAGVRMRKYAHQLRLLRAEFQLDVQRLMPAAGDARNEEGRVSIAMDGDSMATWASPALDALTRSGLPLEVAVDGLGLTRELLQDGRALGCVTDVAIPPAGCKSVALGTLDYVAVAHPDYMLEHLCAGLGAHNFFKARFVACDGNDSVPRDFIRHAFGPDPARLDQRFAPSAEGRLRAVLAGWGVGILPESLAREPLLRGRLSNVAPSHVMRVPLYWQCWNAESEVLDTIGAALVEAMRKAIPAPPLPEGCEDKNSDTRAPALAA